MQATARQVESAGRDDAPAGAELARLEGALLQVLKRVVSRPLQDALGSRHVERAGYLALVRLEACGEARLSDLAAALELDLSTVSRQVRVLVELGLVSRRADADDRRAARLALTPTGRAELRAQRAERHRILGGALHDWPERDREHLVSLLERLAGALPGPAAAGSQSADQ